MRRLSDFKACGSRAMVVKNVNLRKNLFAFVHVYAMWRECCPYSSVGRAPDL